MFRLPLGPAYFSHVVLYFNPENLGLAVEILPEEFQDDFIRISRAATQAKRALGLDGSLRQYEVRASAEVVELNIFPPPGSVGFTPDEVYEFENIHPGIYEGGALAFMPVSFIVELNERIVSNIEYGRWDAGIGFE